jgi:hypothetical protein
MGAHNFSDSATAKNASEAYDICVSRALFEFGHDTYNGTISTTSGFTVGHLDGKASKRNIQRWETGALDRTDKWGDCECLELPRGHAKGAPRGHRRYLFVGWAAS